MMDQENAQTITVFIVANEETELLNKTVQSVEQQRHVSVIYKVLKNTKEKPIPIQLNEEIKKTVTPFLMFMMEGDILPKSNFLASQINVLTNKTKRKNIEDKRERLLPLKTNCSGDEVIVFPKNMCISPFVGKKPKEHRFSKEFIRGIYSISIIDNYFALQTALCGCVIRREVFDEIQFKSDITFEYMQDVVLRILLNYGSYAVNNKAVYHFYDPKENQYLFHLPAHYADWYEKSIENYVIPLIQDYEKEGQLPTFLQNYLVYYIRCRLMTNIDNRNKKQILAHNQEHFFHLLKEVLSYIDDYYLLNQDQLLYLAKNPEIHCMLLSLKYGEGNVPYEYVPSIDKEGNPDIEMKFKENIISRLSAHRFSINVMNYIEGKLCIDGSLINIFRYCDLKFYALFEGKSVLVKDTDAYSLTKYFGIPAYRRITYHLEFLLKKNIPLQKLSFYAEYQGKRYPLKITFANHWAKLSKSPRYSYWRFNEYLCHHANDAIVIKKANVMNVLKRETQFQLNLIHIHSRKSMKALGMRWIYWITRPYFSKKKIWLMLDKLYKGGDSSEYLYRYCGKKDDGVTKYYLINKDTKEYRELKKDGFHPLVNGSLLHKLVFLNADLILITNSHLFPFNGYTKSTSKYIRGLCNFTSMCLQHGLTVQKCAMAQRRIIDNTTGYFLASRYEYTNLMHHAYGYAGFDYLHLTGIGRYDGLINNDKRQILISPTWRMYNALPVTTSEGEQRGYNPDFKNTEYFHIYNRLINNEKLIECAKKTGYKIKYLLHPILSSQVDDFTPNSELEVIPSVGDLSYEKILTESSLMVTDYSGVQFDFAYMRKPIVYFHPEELPAHYEDGIFFYDTMGFGEICTKSDELVDLLCKYMEENCVMKDKYRKRADDFFVYNDHNNCERIYNKIMEYQKKIDKDKLRKEI